MGWGNVFEGIPFGLSRQELLILDAIDLLIPLAGMEYARMRDMAIANDALEDRMSATSDPHNRSEIAKAKSGLQLALLATVGSFISTAERLCQVVRRIPADGDIRLTRQEFITTLQQYDRARGHLDQLDQAMPAVTASGQGALGALSWHHLDVKSCAHTVIVVLPGHPSAHGGGAARLEQVATADDHEKYRSPVDDFWFTIGDAPYHLTGVQEQIDKLERRLNVWSRQFDIKATPDGR